MTIRNRELSQFGSFIYIQNDTKDIGITTGATPYVGIGTTNATSKFHVLGQTKLEGDVEITGVSTFQDNVNLGDNDRLRLGDGQDLQIYHGGSNSIIQDSGDGDLFIAGDNVVRITNSEFTETKALFTTNGSVELYYDNSKKFETTGVGATIYDTLYVGTGVTISGSSGTISATTINAQIEGNAGTATSLATARDFSITGDFVTASAVSFDGTGAVALAATITADSIELGTYTAGDYIESTSGITSEIVVTGGTGEGSTPTIGLSSNLVLPGTLEVNDISTFNGISTFTNETSFTGITTFTNQLFTTDINNSGIVSATAFYQNGVLIVDAALEVWEPIGGNGIYRELGNVGIGTSTNLKKLSVNGQIESQATQGTAPFVVSSTTTVPNLSAALLDGKSAPTGDIVGTTDTQTLTNKTLTTPIITSISNSGTQTVPTGTGTLVSTNSVGVITTGMIGDLEITNDDVSNSAAIAYSKLNLAGSIVDGDISTGTIANDKLANSTISGISLGSNLNDLTRGDFITYSSGTTYNGSTAITIGVAGTTINTGNTLVARDASGDFTAGTATLYGVTLNGGSLNLNGNNITGTGNVNITGIVTATGLSIDVGAGTTAIDVQGSEGQLFSVTNNLTSGSIFSVNDVSGIPSIDVDADGTVLIAPYGGNFQEQVGIGTTNPAYKLDVNGEIRTIYLRSTGGGIINQQLYLDLNGREAAEALAIRGGNGSTGGAYVKWMSPTGDTAYVGHKQAVSGGTGYDYNIYTRSGNGFIVNTGDSSDYRLYITPAGNVGIGTTNPAYKLDVNGDIRLRGEIRDSNDSAGTSGYVLASNGPGSAWSWQEVSGAGVWLPDADENLFAGTGAGSSLSNGSDKNILVGYCAGANLTNFNSYENIFIGSYAGFCMNTLTNHNVFIGRRAGCRVAGGAGNNIIGYNSGNTLTDNTGFCGNYNNFFGSFVGSNNLSGSCNNFFGFSVGRCNTSGCYNVFLGAYTGYRNTTGNYNTFLGAYVGYCNTDGSNNVFIGLYAGRNNTTQSNSIAIGSSAGRNNAADNNIYLGQEAGWNSGRTNNVTGTNNFFVGVGAGGSTTSGSRNNFIGRCAGSCNTTGSSNNFFGDCAGRDNNIGSQNNFFGDQAGLSNATGCFNNFFGQNAGKYNTTGLYNNFFGRFAGNRNTDGDHNNFFGQCSGYCNSTGCHNTFIGQYAGKRNTTGNCNTMIGLSAGCCATVTGEHNIFLGSFAGKCASGSGGCNNFIGRCAGSCNTTGSNNTFIGYFAGCSNTTGNYNIFFGRYAGQRTTTANCNTMIGYNAGQCSTSTGQHNIFLGSFAGRDASGSGGCNNFIGRYAGKVNTFGTHNNFIGSCAGAFNDNGQNNNFIGHCAGRFNTSGCYNNFIGCEAGYCNTTGNSNTFIGNQAGLSNTTGSFNIFIGDCTGRAVTSSNNNYFIGVVAGACGNGAGEGVTGTYNNFIGRGAGKCAYGTGACNNFFGAYAGKCNTTGSSNIFIGSCAGCVNTTGGNNIAIGFNAGQTTGSPSGLINFTTSSNCIVMGNASHSCAAIQIAWTVISDIRDKCVYGEVPHGKGFLQNINPIKYSFKDRETGEVTDERVRYGFSAQEIAELEGDEKIISSKSNIDKWGVTHEHLLPVLVNAVKELDAENKELKERLSALEEKVNSLLES